MFRIKQEIKIDVITKEVEDIVLATIEIMKEI